MNPRLLDRIALGVALASLLIIGVRPSSTRKVASGVAVLRTPGATLQEARAVAESLGGVRVVDLEAGERPGSEARLHLVGWGLDGNEIRRWGDRDLIFHQRQLPSGVRRANWPGSVAIGSTVEVEVEVAGPRGMQVVLQGEDGAADSAAIPTGGTLRVALRHTPRAAGSALYRLRSGAAVDSFSVLVVAPSLPPTLILASAPSREWSDLRDWLARQGASVTFRTSVARGKTRIERLNSGARSDDPLSRRALTATGIVITDGRTLAALSRAERMALEGAVAEGLGVVVVLDDERRAASGQLAPWRLTPVADLTERQVRPRADGRAISPTPVAASGSVMATGPFGSRTLLDDGQGGVLAMGGTLGRGRVVATVVTGAGRWLRGGEPAAFAAYWHRLAGAAARDDKTEVRWELPFGPVLVDRETPVARSGLGGEAWTMGDDSVPGAVDPLAPEWRRARWWPTSAGWNALGAGRVYVGGPSSWRAWQAAERSAETQRAIARHRGEAMPGDRVPLRTPWPLLPFYLLFIAAAAVLWRKVR